MSRQGLIGGRTVPLDQRLAFILLRVSLGMNFLGHGVVRLMHGDAAFAQGMVKQLAETPLPHGFVYGFGVVLPFIEATIGALLIAGLLTRWVLIAGALLMISLLVGITLKQDWPTAGLQLVYSLLFSLLLFLRERYDASWLGLLRRDY